MAERKQYFGIKFPFTTNNLDGFFVDLNNNFNDKVASEMAHVMLTPKGSRIRKPDFGTDLIKYLFEPNDEMTWESVREEVIDAVSKYVPGVKINEIGVTNPPEEPSSTYLDVRYTVTRGNKTENGRMAIRL